MYLIIATLMVGEIISKLKLELKVTRVTSRILCWSSLYTKHQDGFNCGKHITHIPGYFSYVNVVILPDYKTLLCTYSALETKRISSQMKQYNADMSHCQYMFSKRKQQWSHIKILLSSTNTTYNFNIMKVCITFYAFLNPGEKKSDFWFSLWNSIFFISHFQTNILIIL
jgi:hypothetical protein